MLFSSFIASTLLASGALAQYGYDYGSSGSSSAAAAPAETTTAVATSTISSGATPSGSVSVQVVQVSDNSGSLRFYPDDITAAAGSMVQFQFHPKNHSVVQSAFSNPCEPIHDVMANVTGFKSGFMPVAAGATTMSVFTIMVNDTKPIWFYCSQKPHCQKGMVGVINAPGGSKTIDTFRTLAEQAAVNGTTTAPTSGSSGSATTSSGPASQTTNAAARLVGSASLAGVAIAALAFLL